MKVPSSTTTGQRRSGPSHTSALPSKRWPRFWHRPHLILLPCVKTRSRSLRYSPTLSRPLGSLLAWFGQVASGAPPLARSVVSAHSGTPAADKTAPALRLAGWDLRPAREAVPSAL